MYIIRQAISMEGISNKIKLWLEHFPFIQDKTTKKKETHHFTFLLARWINSCVMFLFNSELQIFFALSRMSFRAIEVESGCFPHASYRSCSVISPPSEWWGIFKWNLYVGLWTSENILNEDVRYFNVFDVGIGLNIIMSDTIMCFSNFHWTFFWQFFYHKIQFSDLFSMH